MTEAGHTEPKVADEAVPPTPQTHTLSAIQTAALRGALREAAEANDSRNAVIGEILASFGASANSQLEIVDAFKGIVRIHSQKETA